MVEPGPPVFSFEGIDPQDAALIREAIGTAIKSFEPLTVA